MIISDEPKKVFVVTGFSALLNTTGPVGVALTIEGAERIAKKYDYMLDKSLISEMEVEP
jgi:hypothetical protein